MIVYFIEDNENSFYTAVFNAYYTDKKPEIITSEQYFLQTFDTEIIKIENDNEKAKRVKNAVIKFGGIQAVEDIVDCLKSGESDKQTVAYEYVKLLFEKKQPVIGMMADVRVINFWDKIKRVRFEVHRFKGFLRFAEIENGNYYAYYRPDNDITALLMPHFVARYNSMSFAIHDVKRNIIGIYNGKNYIVFQNNGTVEISFSKEEQEMQNLWKKYYTSVNIKERKNLRQQDGFLPRRYRKNMTEFKP